MLSLKPTIFHRRKALAIAGMLWAPAVWAGISDTFQPFVGVNYAYDDNLLRLPEGTPSTSDNYRTAIAGIQFERPLGRQVFSGSVRASRVSFDKYSALDYNGKDGQANWQWQLGNHLSGSLGASYVQTLTPFTDFHSSEANVRVQRGAHFDGAWRMHPSWQLRTGFTRSRYEYDLSSQRFLDRTEENSELGIDYLLPTGSSIGLQGNHSRGDYPNPLHLGAQVLDQGYTQNEVKFKLFWRLSEQSQLQVLAGHARRDRKLAGGRDASGTNGRLNAIWSPRAVLRVTGSAWREFVPFEGSAASYALSKGASLAAQWTLSGKLRADASYKVVKRDFIGFGSSSALAGDTQDSTRSTNLNLSYQLRNNVQLSSSLFQEKRSAAPRFTSGYRARGATLSANVQF